MPRKLRVLFVLHNVSGGGSETLTQRIILGLPAESFECAVVSLMPVGLTAEAIRSAGARLHVLGYKGGLDLGMTVRLRKLIQQESPDIINTHHISPLLHTWLASLSLVRRPPLLHTVHVLPEIHRHHGGLSQKALRLYHFLLRRADHVVCVSQAERERLRQVPRLPAWHVTAIPNGIDLRRFCLAPPAEELRKEFRIPPGAFVITNVGAFRAQKNQVTLVEAFGRVAAQRKDVVLVLVGGPCEDESFLRAAQERAKALGLEDRLRFLGQRPDVPQVLALTDVYVQPSLYEGLPLSVLEAMAMQRAVVATDVGGNNELVKDGRTGILVPPNDPQAICDAVLRLLDAPSLRASLGAAAREWVSKGYTESCMIAKYEMLYRILAGGPL
jgi:glycosyltransferase involved in cell wall biosynthesis